MSTQSNIAGLLNRLDKLQAAAEVARGDAKTLVNAAPLEIHLYNIATRVKNELAGFRAMIEDSQGIYMSTRDGDAKN